VDVTNGIKSEQREAYIKRFISRLSLPKEYMKEALKEVLLLRNYAIINMAYFDEKTNSTLYLLIANDYAEGAPKFNFAHAQINTKLVENVFVIENFTNSSEIIKNNEDIKISKIETEMFMEYFAIVALTKLAKYLNIPIPEKRLEKFNPNSNLKFLVFLPSLEKIDGFLKTGNTVVDLVDKLAHVFGHSKSVSLKDVIKGEGFSKFQQTAVVDITKGIRLELKEKYFERVSQRIQVPDQYKKDFVDKIADIRDFGPEETKFVKNNIGFSTGNAENPFKFVLVLYMEHEDTQKFDFIYSTVMASFALGDDIMVIETKKHSFGSDSDKVDFVHNARNIKADDINTLMTFLQLVSVKSLADHLRISVEIPPLT